MPIPTLRRDQVSMIVAGLLLSLLAWLSVKPWDIHAWMIGAPLGRDFVNFWMAPRLVLAGEGATLTDLPAYTAAIRTAFGIAHDPRLLFVYPPHTLLFTVPLAALPFRLAVLVWTALNLGALACTLRLLCPPPRGWPMLAACLSPAAAAMVMYGHFGGLLALGATCAVLESGRRPLLAGLCLAGLTVKPQFALCLGMILLGRGHWRCLVAASLGTAALVGLSAAAFGVEAWQRFVTVTMPMQSAFITEFRADMIQTSVSAYFSARFWGLPAGSAWTIQGAVAVLALGSGMLALRRPSLGPAEILVVLLAALTMQPYAAHYDLVIVAPAMTMVVLARDPKPSPFLLLTWLLVPLARMLYVFDFPILGLIVPAALLAQALRLPGLDRPPGSAGRSPALEPVA